MHGGWVTAVFLLVHSLSRMKAWILRISFIGMRFFVSIL
ncbi:hypothetical protein CLV98_10398 [Dyadobacter jejuensis]|uniref:Uncharacterized protein n=1 Tax=Dyadobacter jejuensis TaxID=1082580 RepID=A0A316AMG6_9BACT|nr:hypothetical protein CLV98_10398 [Dyadobacter jejuensis]